MTAVTTLQAEVLQLFRHYLFGAGDDLVDVEGAAVYVDGVWGGAQGSRCARGVAVVALAQVLAELFGPGGIVLRVGLGDAAAFANR